MRRNTNKQPTDRHRVYGEIRSIAPIMGLKIGPIKIITAHLVGVSLIVDRDGKKKRETYVCDNPLIANQVNNYLKPNTLAWLDISNETGDIVGCGTDT